MARRVFARFVDAPDGRIEVLAAGSSAVEDIADAKLKTGDEVIVFVPGTDVTALEVTLPARNEREARRAARFAIEDDVASPVEALHVALSPKSGDEPRKLLVCSEALMEAWQARLQEEGIDAAMVIPDHAVLPNQNSAVDAGERILLQIDGRAMALDRDVPDDLLKAVVSSAAEPVDVLGSGLSARLNMPASGDVAGHPLETLAQLADGQDGLVNLAQGKFAKRTALTLPDIGTWRKPLAVAAAAAMVWMGYLNLETHSLNQASDALRDQAVSRYAAVFTEEGRVANPAGRIQAKLGENGPSRLDFESTAAALYAALQSVDGASLRTLRFDREQGLIRVSVEYGAYGDDLRLAEALSASGLTAQLGDTRNAGNRITGELTLGGGV